MVCEVFGECKIHVSSKYFLLPTPPPKKKNQSPLIYLASNMGSLCTLTPNIFSLETR